MGKKRRPHFAAHEVMDVTSNITMTTVIDQIMDPTGIAAEYSRIPDKILEALGGEQHLKERVEALSIEMLTPWPTYRSMSAYGIRFSYYKGSYTRYEAKVIRTDVNQYSLEVAKSHETLLAETVSLAQLATTFFKFDPEIVNTSALLSPVIEIEAIAS